MLSAIVLLDARLYYAALQQSPCSALLTAVGEVIALLHISLLFSEIYVRVPRLVFYICDSSHAESTQKKLEGVDSCVPKTKFHPCCLMYLAFPASCV